MWRREGGKRRKGKKGRENEWSEEKELRIEEEGGGVVRTEQCLLSSGIFFLRAHNTTQHKTTQNNTCRASQCADSCGGECPQRWPVASGSGVLHTLHQRQHPAEERACQE